MNREPVLKVVLVLVGLLFSSFAHGAVMAVLAVHIASERGGLLIAVAVLVIIGVALIALAPAKPSRELAHAAAA